MRSQYDIARDFVANTHKNIFITGKAGTGKTTFLHEIKSFSEKQVAIVAPTGVAAMNAGGSTIHSFFQLPISPFLPTPDHRKELISKQRMQRAKRAVLRNLELLVIDEVSMVRADLLDAIDTVLQYIRFSKESFGGVQVILLGDMHQLPPVAKEYEGRLLANYYKNLYFFNSYAFQDSSFAHVEFDKVFRQSDPHFIQLLNELRNNTLTPQSKTALQSRYVPNFKPKTDDLRIILTTHNGKANSLNNHQLDILPDKATTFEADIEGVFPENVYPTAAELTLKKGARVMFIKNDNENHLFYNGKLGVVTEIDGNDVRVLGDGDKEEVLVSPMSWENIRYSTDKNELQLEEKKIGEFRQLPLRLAWAITIHKSQGLTFEQVIIDAGDSFAGGQVYVALSRCKSLEGITLTSNINPNSLDIDTPILEFSAQKQSTETLQNSLAEAEREFYTNLLCRVFHFRPSYDDFKELREVVEISPESFGESAENFMEEIDDEFQIIVGVTEKFQAQIKNICLVKEFDEVFLHKRIKAAYDYLYERIDKLSQRFSESPLSTESRPLAKQYDEIATKIIVLLEWKMYLFNGILSQFTVSRFYDLRRDFAPSNIKLKTYAKHRDIKAEKSENPLLLQELFSLRNSLCDKEGVPLYFVCGNKTLIEISNKLPQTKKDLLKINGIGKVKAEKYGKTFLGCVKEYIITHSDGYSLDL